MKSICKALAPLALAATLLSANPAHALSSYCAVFVIPPVYVLSCETLQVRANLDGGFIYYEVSALLGYRVIDTVNGFTVASDNSGINGHAALIFGLNHEYKVAIQGWSGYAYINNT